MSEAASPLEERLRALESDTRRGYASGLIPTQGVFVEGSEQNPPRCCALGAAWYARERPGYYNWMDWVCNTYGLTTLQCNAIIQGFDETGYYDEQDPPDLLACHRFGDRIRKEFNPCRS